MRGGRIKANKIGEKFGSVGSLLLGIGVIVSLVLGIVTENLMIMVGGPVLSIVSGFCFIGFGEIINLLQKNLDAQIIIIKTLNGQIGSLKNDK